MSDATRFEIRLPRALADRIEDWRRGQTSIPNRAEAARKLIERGLMSPATAQSEGDNTPPAAAPLADTLARCRWLASNFRDGGDVAMNVRISERSSLQVDFLIAQMGITKRQFVEEVLRDACATELAKRRIEA